MKLKKFLSALVSGAMILGTMAAVPVFADGSVGVEYNGTTYASFTEAREAVAPEATEITFTIHGKVVLPSGYITNITGNAENAETVNFKAADGDATAELALEGTNANIIGLDMTGAVKTVNYEDLILSRANGSWIGDIGHANNYFTTAMRGVADGVVNYTSCTFPNGSCNNFYSETVYTNCKFNNDTEYGLWIYGGKTEVTGATFTGAKGVQAYSEDANADVITKITDSTFNGITNKPAIISGTKGTVTLEKITTIDCEYGLLQTKPKDGNASLPCASVTIDGEEPAYVAKVGSSLYTDQSFAEKEAGEKGTTATPVVAKVNGQFYTSLQDALDAARDGETVKVLNDITLTEDILMTTNKAITLDLNGKTLSCEGGRIMLYGADMTVTGNGVIDADLTNGSQTAIEVLDAGSTLTVDSVNVSAGANNMIFAAGNGGNIIINGGTYTVTDGGTCFYVFDNSKLTINNGIFNGTGNEGTGIVWAFNGSAVNVYNGTFNVDNDTTPDYGISSAVNWTFCDYRGLIGFPFSASLAVNSKGNIQVYGGTYNVNPNKMPNLGFGSTALTSLDVDYVAPGYVSTKNADGTYTVAQSEATVIDTAKTTGATVTLDNLTKNAAVDHEPDATYKVVVSTPSAADADAANDEIASIGDTNASKAMFDISVVKIDSNGVETDLGGTNPGSIKNQPVTLTLGETPVADSVKVYHVVGENVEEITEEDDDLKVDGNKVSFIAPSFSTYAVSYTAAPAAEDTITDEVGVVFSPVSQGSNQYYITLKSLKADKKINRFMSTDLVFVNKCSTVDYDITPAANMTASVVSEKVDTVNNTNSREYRFNMDGKTFSSATGTGITIGTITFYGYGTLNFSIDEGYTSGHAINIVNTAKIANNIVDNYMVSGGTLIVNNAANKDAYPNYIADDEKGKITDTLVPETKDLTVKIAYNNAINNNAAAYQDMTVTISGGDLDEPLTVELGTDPKFSESFANRNAQNEVISTVTFADNTYVLNIKGELTMNCSYTVTVSGAGYRTARYTVTMTGDKTLNFWNNVMDNEENIETGVGTPSKTNFLAGDIVKDNQINIYDLSAVVSYFGTSNNVTAESAYARYDLNRDGKIDSKDVAYVLVSWNN